MKELDEIEDNKVLIVGENWQERFEKAGKCRLALLLMLQEERCRRDFESIIERKIHHNLNEAQGLWHMGQRDLNWIRISNNAKKTD